MVHGRSVLASAQLRQSARNRSLAAMLFKIQDACAAGYSDHVYQYQNQTGMALPTI